MEYELLELFSKPENVEYQLQIDQMTNSTEPKLVPAGISEESSCNSSHDSIGLTMNTGLLKPINITAATSDIDAKSIVEHNSFLTNSNSLNSLNNPPSPQLKVTNSTPVSSSRTKVNQPERCLKNTSKYNI